MIIEQVALIDAPAERVWRSVSDVPTVARFVPGVESVTATGDGGYTGALRVSVGPISARLEGTLRSAQRDDAQMLARMDIQANDRRLGTTVTAKMTMQVTAVSPGTSRLSVHTDAAVSGRLAQFGQAIIKRQADATMAQFARDLSAALEKGDNETAQRG